MDNYTSCDMLTMFKDFIKECRDEFPKKLIKYYEILNKEHLLVYNKKTDSKQIPLNHKRQFYKLFYDYKYLFYSENYDIDTLNRDDKNLITTEKKWSIYSKLVSDYSEGEYANFLDECKKIIIAA